MIAVDTNIIVRIATGDDPSEKAVAQALFDNHRVLIAKTVLLEAEWVLRARYRYPPDEIAELFRFLAESQNVFLEDAASVYTALRYYEAGADFADALHLASAGDVPFYTLDRTFCRKAIREGIAPPVEIVRA